MRDSHKEENIIRELVAKVPEFGPYAKFTTFTYSDHGPHPVIHRTPDDIYNKVIAAIPLLTSL